MAPPPGRAAFNPVPFLRSVLGPMAADGVEALAGHVEVYTLPAGAFIWRQGDRPTRFLSLISGMVKVSRGLPNGTVVTLGLFGPRDPLGVVAAVDGIPYPADALVLSRSADLLSLPMEALHARLAQDPAFGRALLACISTRVRGLHSKLIIVSSGGVPARLATLVLQLAERYGDEIEGQGWFVPVALTRKTMAELIESRIETVIRLVSRWQADGLVRLVPGGIEVPELAHLQAIAEAG